ncbi:MAG: radical SAM protein [Bacteroidetes bacterium]|nr:radical SAM protein [Bacteroidota bacterium]
MQLLDRQLRKAAPGAINFILGHSALRKVAANYARKYMHRIIVNEDDGYTKNIRFERYTILSNLVVTLERALTNKNISPQVRKKILDIFVSRVFLENEKNSRENFIKEFGQEPPGFITISPGKKCNLQCTGCYAGSGAKSTEKLDYSTVDRIVREKTELWNSFFTVISGGEPLMWRSEGKGILDLCREHPDNYFMMYTNGTMIDKKMAKAMAEVGNLTPAISVEGFEEETDERRGKGVFGKVLEAMANLREVGVPFGISVTATKNNAEKIVSDEFIDFFFEKQGAVYGWMFQYMPIGRSQTLDLMVTPEQRKWMFEREKHIIHDKHVFLPDFWNGGVFSSGCLAGGRSGGYIYIDWNGSVTPCVFYPYSKNNIKDIYANGGNLNDALKADLMVGIRKWQRDYGFEKKGKDVKNFIAPCGIRDHYEFTRKHIVETGAKPIDPDAAIAIKDQGYYDGLVEYNNKFSSLTEPIWQKDFIGNGSKEPSPTTNINIKDEGKGSHSVNGNGKLVESEEEVTVGK